MKKLGVVCLSAFLTACAMSAPMQGYRPVGDSKQWHIDGDFNTLSKALKVRIDGQEVMSGKLSFLSGHAELKGKYQDKNVSATCNQTTSYMTAGIIPPKTQCMIFVENERATTLQF